MTKKKGKAKAGAAAEGSAAPVRAKAHQSRLEASFEKKLKAPRDDINHVIGVPYDHWNYASSAAGKAEEARATETGTFKCKVADFELSKRFPATAGKAAFISLILTIPKSGMGRRSLARGYDIRVPPTRAPPWRFRREPPSEWSREESKVRPVRAVMHPARVLWALLYAT